MKTRVFLSLLALTLLQISRAANSPTAATNQIEVFPIGDEQTIINRFTQETDRPVLGLFSNSLDHALALLVAKAHPKPDVTRLVRATIVSLAAEFAKETGRKMGAAQQDTYCSSAALTRSFDPILKGFAAFEPQKVDQSQLIEAGLNGMLKALDWESAGVLPKAQAEKIKRLTKVREKLTEERGIIGLKLDQWPVAHVVSGSPASDAGVHSGDVIIAVNGKHAAEAKTADEALKLLQGPSGDLVKLTVKRGGKIMDFSVKRMAAAAAMVKAQQVETNILLLTIPTFEGAGIAAKVRRCIDDRAAERESVVILDLRNNGGGQPEEANAVADIFLDNKVLQICEFRNGTRIAFKSGAGSVAAGLILLVNKNTGSAAEMLAMALRDNSRATLVGERTIGALIGKDVVEMTNGKMIIFRTEPTVLSPAGHDYSGTGIPPDVSARDFGANGKDTILRRALELACTPVSPRGPSAR